MRNNILKIFLFLSLSFFIAFNVNANQQFNFDITEVEVLEDGNKFKGTKGGTVTTDDGIIINGDTFYYDKLLNKLDISGNVKIEDTIKDFIIYSDDATYLRNQEKIFTFGNSKALNDGLIIDGDNFEYNKLLNIINAYGNVEINDTLKDIRIFSENITYLKNKEKIFTQGITDAIIESKYFIVSSDILFLKNEMELSSDNKSTIYDIDSTKYNLNKFIYFVEKKFLKGQDVRVRTNYLKEKSDEFFFKDGFFDFDKKSFVASETEILFHKTIFDKEREKFIELENEKLNELFKNYYEENDPRIIGVASDGDESKTIIHKGIFTSCKKTDSCPPWSLKSKKITHDKIKKQLIYDHSILNIYDIPVFYFPKFFHPDPTVKRQTGFLKPSLNKSKILGSSLQMPYFKVLGDNSDYTIVPVIFDANVDMLQNEYRREDKNSSFIVDFSIVNGYQSSTIENSKVNSLTHLFSKFDADLDLDNFINSELNIFLERVSNDNYLSIFQQNLSGRKLKPVSTGSLASGLKLSLDHEDYNLTSGFTAYETLSGLNSDRFQYVLPYYNFSKILYPEIDGTISFNSSGSNNLLNTNNLKTSVVNDINYISVDFISNLGFLSNFGMYFKNLNSVGKNDALYKPSPQVEGMSIFNIESSIPLTKQSKKYLNHIIPKVSLRASPNAMKNYSNGGQIVTADSMFSINRLGLSDTFEAGRSLTFGLDYKKEDMSNSDKYSEFKIGTVLRAEEEDYIPKSSSINGRTSNIFGSITNEHYEFIKFDYDFALDNDLSTFEHNSIKTEFSVKNFVTEFTFNEINRKMGSQNSLENTTSIKFDNNNYLTFNTRRNREINLTEYYDLVYEYKNDCLTAGIKYKKTYYTDRDLTPTEDLMFTITLFPLTTMEQNVKQKLYRGEEQIF